MDWFDYLENATCTLKDNGEASKIRSELMTHLDAITNELIEQGWSSKDAQQEALNRMGSPDNIAIGLEPGYLKGFHPGLWIFTWMGLAIGAYGMIFVSLILYPIRVLLYVGLTALSIFGLTLLQMGHQQNLESRWNTLVNMLRPNRYCFLVAGIIGFLEGSRPIWFTFMDHWLVTPSIFLIVLTGVAVVSSFMGTVKTMKIWSPGMVSIGMGVCYAVVSMITGILRHWVIKPTPTNPLIHWFGVMYIQENLRFIAFYSITVWLLSVILAVGSSWFISQPRVTSYGKTLS